MAAQLHAADFPGWMAGSWGGTADGVKMPLTDPAPGYWLDYKDQVLTLHFTLPLKKPVKAKDVKIDIYDPTIFVDFSFAKQTPVHLVGAPAGCKLVVGRPQDMGAELAQRLSQLGPDQRDPSLTIGAEFANKISVKCP